MEEDALEAWDCQVLLEGERMVTKGRRKIILVLQVGSGRLHGEKPRQSHNGAARKEDGKIAERCVITSWCLRW
jgi:hypothetical protein